jgi:hypothetical protein
MSVFYLTLVNPMQLNRMQVSDPPGLRMRLRRDAAGLPPHDIPLPLNVTHATVKCIRSPFRDYDRVASVPAFIYHGIAAIWTIY